MTVVIAILLFLLVGLFIYIYRGGPTLPPETDTIIENVLKSELPEIVRGETGFASANGLNIWYEGTAEVVLYDLRKRKGINIQAAFQHQAAVRVSGSRYGRLKTLNVPTLIIHGTADQFIPVEHGRKLAEIVPGAKSLWLEGVGHVFPVPDMDTLIKNIIVHLEG